MRNADERKLFLTMYEMFINGGGFIDDNENRISNPVHYISAATEATISPEDANQAVLFWIKLGWLTDRPPKTAIRSHISYSPGCYFFTSIGIDKARSVLETETVPPLMDSPDMRSKDIFICHAGSDKTEIVRPIVNACEQAGIKTWLDENEISWGDSITDKINDALSKAAYVVVVLSTEFLDKPWPERELNSAINIEASNGEVKVLPLLVGNKTARANILNKYPLLNDKRYLIWNGDSSKVTDALLVKLGRKATANIARPHEANPNNDLAYFPIPKLKTRFTQRDKDQFIKKSFATVRSYFKEALEHFAQSYTEIDTDFDEIHNYRFVCTIYRDGNVVSKCKIWRGSMHSDDGIAYQCGEHITDSSDSFNEVLAVCDDHSGLGFSTSGLLQPQYPSSCKGSLSPKNAAEHLWTLFTSSIEQ